MAEATYIFCATKNNGCLYTEDKMIKGKSNDRSLSRNRRPFNYTIGTILMLLFYLHLHSIPTDNFSLSKIPSLGTLSSSSTFAVVEDGDNDDGGVDDNDDGGDGGGGGEDDNGDDNEESIENNIATTCLRLSNPNMTTLNYPDDAYEHYLEIHKVMAKYIANVTPHCWSNYCGPWIENVWINHFQKEIIEKEEILSRQNNNTNNNKMLQRNFGYFIPLFIPWVDNWVRRSNKRRRWIFQYPNGFVDELKSVLRSNVPYITVSQNDEGITGKNEILLNESPWSNIVVLSAGGYGHVPIPLLKQEETIVTTSSNESNKNSSSSSSSNNNTSISERAYLISYVGNLKNDPFNIRVDMNDILKEKLQKGSAATSNNYTHYFNAKNGWNEWHNIMKDSYMSLVPRGYGRSSFHFYETIQMGLIPIYVYYDEPWIPYQKLFEKKQLGYAVSIKNFTNFLDYEIIPKFTTKSSTKNEMILKQEERIRSYRESHFTFKGIMNKISDFMLMRNSLEGNGDDFDIDDGLICQKLPNSTTHS